MSTSDQSADPFATALRTAIRESGLSLEGIVRRLGAKGTTLSVGTLSHWQSGRTSPARADSLRAIAHLEELFGLERDALRRLVTSPFLRGRPIRESRMAPIASSYVHAGST